MPGLVEVLRTEGIEGVRYALWDTTGGHWDYGPCIRRAGGGAAGRGHAPV